MRKNSYSNVKYVSLEDARTLKARHADRLKIKTLRRLNQED